MNQLQHMLEDKTKYYFIRNLKHINVAVGSYVWNQHKDDLCDIADKTDLPILIYTPCGKRMNKVKNAKPEDVLHDTVIAIYRGHGGRESHFKFEFAMIDSNDYPNGFMLENHILYIYGDISVLNVLMRGFENEQTQLFINRYVSNGALSVKELMNNIAIFK